MYGGNYYGGNEYGGNRGGSSITAIISKLITVILTTKNRVARFVTKTVGLFMTSKNQGGKLSTGNKEGVMSTKGDNIII